MSANMALSTHGVSGTVPIDVASIVPLVVESGTVGTVRAWLAIALVLVGALFLTVGTVGLLRMPNIYNRMHATTKATTVGVVSMFLAAFVVFGPGGDGLIAIVGIVFLFLTVPTGSHVLVRAALRMGVPFTDEATWPDEE